MRVRRRRRPSSCAVLVCIGLIPQRYAFDLRLQQKFVRRKLGQSQLLKPYVSSSSMMLMDTISSSSAADNQRNGKLNTFGLYIHWPFCRRRCRYCDFAIVPVGANHDKNQSTSQLDLDYTGALLKEMEHTAAKHKSHSASLVKSIYFGGGTPSLAPIDSLADILSFVHNAFCVDPDCEKTIEIDPGTFSLQKLEQLKELGFNRLSFGIQSFDDATLALIGRTHRLADIQASMDMIRRVYGGGDALNWSIDLISGLPGVSLTKWVETLEIAVSLDPKPTHISVYDLQVEPGTVFGNWYSNDDTNGAVQRARRRNTTEIALPSPEDAAFMYKYASGYLKARGYEHYEVSSYALKSPLEEKSSFRSRHNQIYWAVDGRWLAFGLGASSCDGNMVVRPRELSNYIQWVDNLSSSSVLDNDIENITSDFELLTDIVLKRLRTSDGLDLFLIRDLFGKHFSQAILRGVDLAKSLDLASYDATTGCLKLRQPDGFLFSNSIISSVFVELEKATGVSN